MHSLLEEYLDQVAAGLGPLPVALRDEEMREAQAHLESSVKAMEGCGVPGDEAVYAVIKQFGQPEAVAHGLVVAWKTGEKKKKEIVMKERIVFGTSMVMVTLATLWLVFAASIISRSLNPEGQVLIHASEGARLSVQHGIVQVLSAGNNGTSVESFHGAILLPAIAVPFIFIVGFAVVGCCSVLRPRRVA